MKRARCHQMLVAAAVALGAGCNSEPHRPPQCTPGELRACTHACGRGVEQCLESGAGWSVCACIIQDGGLPFTDTGTPADGDEDAEAAETGSTRDAAGDSARDADTPPWDGPDAAQDADREPS